MSQPSPPVDEGPPGLIVPRGVLQNELEERIARGRLLLHESIPSEDDLERIRRDYYTWDDFNAELLRKRFSTSEIAQEYKSVIGMIAVGGLASLSKKIEDLHREIDYSIRHLESVKERLPLFDEVTPEPPAKARRPAPSLDEVDTIFVVHGHSNELKQEVLRFLDQVTNLTAIVLHEQANAGRTIIEKFEEYAAEAAFAVVLVTSDDEGRAKGGEDLKPRARQNVVFELGFFFGELGRSRVAALFEPGTELPSDMSGVLYTALDQRGAWKMELAREMRAAGLPVDLNKVL